MKIVLALIIAVIWNSNTKEFEVAYGTKEFKNMGICQQWVAQEAILGPMPGSVVTYRECRYEYRI